MSAVALGVLGALHSCRPPSRPTGHGASVPAGEVGAAQAIVVQAGAETGSVRGLSPGGPRMPGSLVCRGRWSGGCSGGRSEPLASRPSRAPALSLRPGRSREDGFHREIHRNRPRREQMRAQRKTEARRARGTLREAWRPLYWGDSGVRRSSWKLLAETGMKTQREKTQKSRESSNGPMAS